MKFEQEFDNFYEEQMRTAAPARLEQLKRDKTGEKMLYCTALRPVMPSLEGLVMEYETLTVTGVRMYIDFYLPQFRWGIECLGFVPHAEKLTRDRFDFEQVRIVSMAANRIEYIPFTKDQLDKKPDYCRRTLYLMLGQLTSMSGKAMEELSIYEREVIRYALYLNRPFRAQDVMYCTQQREDTVRKLLRGMLEKELIKPTGKGATRFHEYTLESIARNYMR